MAATENNIDETPENWTEPTADEAQAEQELSIGRRLGNWRTLASFGFAILVLVFVVVKVGIDPATIWARLHTINLGLFLSAFLLYYLTFPLRGFRWKVLLENAYSHTHRQAVSDMSVPGLTEIIYISWFVNCVVPAKLGDLYRAYLAKLWVQISWSKTIGTVIAERIVDILILSLTLAVTGLLAFHSRIGHIGIILWLGIALAIAGILVLITMKTMSHRIRRLIPGRFVDRYVAFEEGTLDSFRRLPLLFGITALIWIMEGGRLQLVFLSLGLHTNISSVPFAPMLFFALGTAVLTTIPFTPGGLGLVEGGLLSLMIYLGIAKTDAAAVVLIDRILSYYSVAVIGFVVYLVSKRSHFRQHI